MPSSLSATNQFPKDTFSPETLFISLTLGKGLQGAQRNEDHKATASTEHPLVTGSEQALYFGSFVKAGSHIS